MARVHLFSSTPHNEKRRRISTTASSSLVDDNTNNTTNKHNHANINELSRLAQLNRGPPPTISEDTHALDITAVPSPNTAHTTISTAVPSPSPIHHPPSHPPGNDNNRDTIMKDDHSPPGPDLAHSRPSAALSSTSIPQNTTADMELVNAFAAALSGKFETFQMIWDKVRRGSTSGSGHIDGENTDEGGQQQGVDVKGKDDQRPGNDNADIMDQEAAATALQLLGLASSSSPTSTAEKQQTTDSDKVKAPDSNDTIPEGTTHDDDTTNATAAAAAAVLRQALAHQPHHQGHHAMDTQAQSSNTSNNNTGSTSNNNISSALSASMLMANYPGLTSPGGTNEGLDIQEEILQDYKRGTWTREEDDLLLLGIKRFGYGRWKEIASTIPGRKGKQLKQRWDNTLASKYVDAELLQNKLRNDDQITKLQQHLEGLASASSLSAPPTTSPSVASLSTQPNNSNSATQTPAPSLSKPSPPTAAATALHRVEPADWTEIAHKITEKVREGDQEAIEALLSQALLGTGHHMESSSTAPPPQQSQQQHQLPTSSLPSAAHVKQEEHGNAHNTNTAPLSTPNTTTEQTSFAQSSTEPSPSQHSPSNMSPSALDNVNYSRSATPNANTTSSASSASPPAVPTASHNTSSSSSLQQHNAPVLNYADAAALSLYQQLSQHHATTTTTNDTDSNGSNNPLATIQALANNQYFLSNLFANVENGGHDATGAALAAAAAAAAAAMAHATSGGGTNTSTAADASSLLATTMRSHLGNNGTNNGSGGGPLGPGDSSNSNKDLHIQDRGDAASANSSADAVAMNNQQHKRRRSDPALANTQSEAMSIYASSSPVTTMVNNQPQTVYPCLFPNCGKAFARLYNLKSHSRTHTDDRPFCCQLCNTAFSRNHDLKRHLKTHVGEKPYKCGGCQKTFSRLDALKRHKSNARNQAICLDT